MGYLVGWSYRRPLSLVYSGTTDLTDYQVKIDLDSTNFDFDLANPDGSDIRFTDSDGVTLLPYWIEKWDANNQVAIIWVKVSSIPASSTKTIYLYYGNPSATSASDGSATFLFYDDMEVWTGWTQYGSGQVSQDSTRAYRGTYSAHKTAGIDPSGAYRALPTALGRNIILEAMINRNSAYVGGTYDRIGLINDFGNGYGVGYDHSTDKILIDIRNSYEDTPIYGPVSRDHMDTWYKLVMKITPTQIIAEKLYNEALEVTVTITNTAYSYFTNFYIFGGYDYWVDLVRIRKYASPEPTVTVGALQQLDSGQQSSSGNAIIRIYNVNKEIANSSEPNASAIVRSHRPVLLYIDYQKGDEDSLNLSFELMDNRVNEYFPLQLQDNNGNLIDYVLSFTKTGRYRVHIPMAENENYLRISAYFNISTSGITNFGSAVIWIVPEYPEH